MNIQAVFFDMGGTIDTFGYTPELRLARTPGIQKLLAKAGIDLGLDNEQLYSVVSLGLARYKTWSLSNEEEISPLRVWSEYILPDYTVDQDTLASLAEDLMCFIETSYFDRNVRQEVPGVLHKIKEMGLKIGLISNVNSRGQVPTNLTEYNLIHYFDPIVISSEYGRRKPDPSIFHHAASLAIVPTSHCLHVGDRISRDIIGAQKAGFGLTVQIKHKYNHEEIDTGATPDYVITQMTELVDILQSSSVSVHPPPHTIDLGSQPVRALLFDAGEILYYRAEKGRFLKEFLNEINLSSEDNHTAEKYELRQQAFRGEISQKEYQTTILNLLGVQGQEPIEQGLKAINDDENNVQFFEGVRDTLLSLKRAGYLMGIVTDTANPVYVKLKWFELGGFGHVWDSIITSTAVGVRKPDPKLYLKALEQLGVSPSQTIFFGHKTSELEGARAIGIKTVAFNFDEDAVADYYIENFTDILSLPFILKQESSDPG